MGDSRDSSCDWKPFHRMAKRNPLVWAFRLVIFAALPLSGCAFAPPSSRADVLPRHTSRPAVALPLVIPVDLIDAGWHTGWAIPAKKFLVAAPIFRPWFHHDTEILVGWGNRRFYMAQSPGWIDGLQALFPSRSVVLLQGIHARDWRDHLPPSIHPYPMRLSAVHFRRLVRYVVSALSFPIRADGFPRQEPWYPGGWFFRSRETYDAFHTCNTWTTGSLQDMGYPVSPDGVLFAGQVISDWRSMQNK